MTDFLQINKNGFIEEVKIDNIPIPYRSGEWAGPAWHVTYGGETHIEKQEAQQMQDGSRHIAFWGIQLYKKITVSEGILTYHLEAVNGSSQPFYPEKLGIFLGIDTYMATYPEWNDKLFPTFLRCEKTHFYGYLSTPSGNILAVASPQPVAGWKLHYNKMFSDNGHRIEGITLELLQSNCPNSRHPKQTCLHPGEKRTWDISFHYVPSVLAALEWASNITEAPVFAGDRLIFEPDEPITLSFFAPGSCTLTENGTDHACIMTGKNRYTVQLEAGSNGERHTADITCGNKRAQIQFFQRDKWSHYLKQAAAEALRSPQKAGSHVESWYGYFSGLLAMRYLPDERRDNAILDSMNTNIPLAYDMKTGRPIVIPKRIQNTSGLVSIAADAWQATKDQKWLTLAENAADFLVDYCQDEEGAFRNGEGIHYTCVLYVAKAIQELWLEERILPGHKTRANKYFTSIKRAVDELVLHLDDIGTEGETTFEDGMISCSMTQISYFALYLPEEMRAPYIKAAEILLHKHRCLERMGSPDCRSRNTTIRFWEAQYDILIPTNMISSPHGWTAWKLYGVWYLYLLTGKTEYLIDTMETLGCCAQLLDANGHMNWGFVVDPEIHSLIMEPDENGYALPVPSVYGECYLPMISSWYQAPQDKPVFGYLGVFEGFETDQGGCCDNDVHEWVKAMGEIVLPYAYLAEHNDSFIPWNLTYLKQEARHKQEACLEVTPMDATVKAVHVNLSSDRDVIVHFPGKDVQVNIRQGWICENGISQSEIPC